MQKLTIQREAPKLDCTFSVMHDASGSRLCDLLEPLVPFPAGEYNAEPYLSPDHGYVVPRYLDIPGHTFIEIHPGNVPPDTKDCQLPGTSRGPCEKDGVTYPDAVLNSRLTFCWLMRLWGFPDYHVDADGKIATALTTDEAATAFFAANPDAGRLRIAVLDAVVAAA